MLRSNRRAGNGLLWTSVALLAFSAANVAAQCPDGTPPPCVASRSPIRNAPLQLNPRAWIVVPFANVTRAPDLDWLRDASVNLLSLDLSRWTDITVVDDKRVADLLRELPPPRGTQPLTLNDGLGLARRAGAGTLVMGDYFKVGKGARFVANVFDVKTGTKVRSVTQQAADQDSLLTAFGPMARNVLAVPAPPDARLGAIGTTRVDAYQEYLAGASALNRFEITLAKQHLLKSLALDSTFALAHYKLSTAIHWDDARTDTTEHAHALAAARLGGSLPPRERALMSGRVASSAGDYERACATLAALVAKDSTDVDALYGLGECQYHAGFLVPEPIDSIRGRMRGNWNIAIAAFRHVLLTDPTYHPAFEHILDVLTTPEIDICPVVVAGCGNDPAVFVIYPIRDGDSLLFQPVRGDFRVKNPAKDSADAARTPRRNMEAARLIAQEWADAGPAEARAHLNLATIELLLGKADAADAELRQIASSADARVRRDALGHRVEANILLGRASDARKLLDTLLRITPEGALKDELAPFLAAFGKLEPLRKALDHRAAAEHWSPQKTRYWHYAPLALLGIPSDSLISAERAYWESAPGDTVCAAGRPRCRATLLWPSLVYAPRATRTWWPYRGTNVSGFRFFLTFRIWQGDTSLVRRLSVFEDTVSAARFIAGRDDQGFSIQAAEGALVLRDSARALRQTQWFVDALMPAMNLMTTSLDDEWRYLVVPRMMLQRADLAFAAGSRDEARQWYTRVLDLWSEADAELQPTVSRIRQALGKL